LVGFGFGQFFQLEEWSPMYSTEQSTRVFFRYIDGAMKKEYNQVHQRSITGIYPEISEVDLNKGKRL